MSRIGGCLRSSPWIAYSSVFISISLKTETSDWISGCSNRPETATIESSMRRLRLLVILATALTLPVQGLAGLAYARSCQEQMGAPGHAVQAGDCCPGKLDQDNACKRGNSPLGKCSACKAGGNCKSPQSYEPTSTPVPNLGPARLTLTTAYLPPPLSHSPDGLWRPPRLR